MRLHRNYNEKTFENQRVDAIISERLTSSPNAIDIYGFCGMSSINEFAQYGRLNTEMIGKVKSNRLLLSYARDISLGLADVHDIGYAKGHDNGNEETSSIVHGDINGIKNLMLTDNQRIKIHDFNRASVSILFSSLVFKLYAMFSDTCFVFQLMRWDFDKNECCKGFRFCKKKSCNQLSPEECEGKPWGKTEFKSERTEVYHLGNLLSALLIKSGILYAGNSDRAIQAITKARNDAYTFDVNARPRARDIATNLDEAYHKYIMHYLNTTNYK